MSRAPSPRRLDFALQQFRELGALEIRQVVCHAIRRPRPRRDAGGVDVRRHRARRPRSHQRPRFVRFDIIERLIDGQLADRLRDCCRRQRHRPSRIRDGAPDRQSTAIASTAAAAPTARPPAKTASRPADATPGPAAALRRSRRAPAPRSDPRTAATAPGHRPSTAVSASAVNCVDLSRHAAHVVEMRLPVAAERAVEAVDEFGVPKMRGHRPLSCSSFFRLASA